ncbi:MAG: phage holin family protein [Leptolyngbyaceae cyanobacterium]
MGFLLTTLMTALSLLVVDLVVPGVTIATFPAALLAAVSIGLVNGSIKPVLFILTLPINILTLGLFSLLLNGFCFWLASLVVPGFAIHGLLAMVLGPVVLSLVSTFLNQYVARRSVGQPLVEVYTPESLDAVK